MNRYIFLEHINMGVYKLKIWNTEGILKKHSYISPSLKTRAELIYVTTRKGNKILSSLGNFNIQTNKIKYFYSF